MAPPPQTRWRAVPESALAWREWDREFVVFNQRTGGTHLLGEFAGEVLRHLVAAGSGATADALAAGLAASPNAADPGAWTQAVAEVLSDLARL